MAQQILVALRRHDQIEEILPCLEEIARPGMRVVFLTRYPVEGFVEWCRDHHVTAEAGRQVMGAARIIEEKYSVEMQRRQAEEKIIPACAALCKRGVEIAVELYAGRAKKAIAQYTCHGDAHLILMRMARGLPLRSLLQKIMQPLGWLRRPSSSPAVLLLS